MIRHQVRTIVVDRSTRITIMVMMKMMMNQFAHITAVHLSTVVMQKVLAELDPQHFSPMVK